MKSVALIVLLSLLLFACEAQTPTHVVTSPPAPLAPAEPGVTTVSNVSQPMPTEADSLPKSNITLKQFENFVYKMTGVGYDIRLDLGYDPLVSQLRKDQKFLAISDNANRLFVFEQLRGNSIMTGKEFYEFVKAPQSELWRYYVNQTEWNWASQPLTEKELSALLPGYSYYSYLNADSTWIDVDIFEKPIRTPQGLILEYWLEMDRYNQFGYMQEHWKDPVLLFKVPCSQRVVVYLRAQPDLDFGAAVQLNQKKQVVLENLQREIEKKEVLMINYSNQIMNFCGVNSEMFKDVNPQHYEDHFRMVINRKVYFKELFNYTFIAKVSLQENKPRDAYHVKDLNMTFVNYDNYMPITNFHLSARILINDSGWVSQYDDVQLAGDPLQQSIVKDLRKSNTLTFGPNATMIIYPYLGTSDTFEPWRFYLGNPLKIRIS